MKTYLLASLALLSGCASVETSAATTNEPQPAQWAYSSDLPLSRPPFDAVHCNWKQRIDQGYVYLEHVGPYSGTGALLPEVHRLLAAQGIKPSGPPFSLFFDDPKSTQTTQLRSRACVPVSTWTQPTKPLNHDALPSQTVAYAVATGPYPQVAGCYPGIFGYMDQMNWAIAGPIREIYLIPPSEVSSFDDLVCEVQVPVTSR